MIYRCSRFITAEISSIISGNCISFATLLLTKTNRNKKGFCFISPTVNSLVSYLFERLLLILLLFRWPNEFRPVPRRKLPPLLRLLLFGFPIRPPRLPRWLFPPRRWTLLPPRPRWFRGPLRFFLMISSANEIVQEISSIINFASVYLKPYQF